MDFRSHHHPMTSGQMSGSVMTASTVSQISTSNTISVSQLSGGLTQAKAGDHSVPTSDDHISSGRAFLQEQPSVVSGEISNGESIEISAEQ